MASIDEVLKTNKFTDDRHRLMANIIYTANWLQANFNEFVKPFGLSSQQYNILRILRGKGDWMTMSDIKSVMVERAPNATRLSDKLLDKGLIERRRSAKDRRIVHLHISKSGLKLLQEIDEVKGDGFQELIEGINPKKAKKFSKFLDELRD